MQIIVINKPWVYSARIYPPPPPTILFVSLHLANFALGFKLVSQESAPPLLNLVSRATAVIQPQSDTPWGVNPQSDAVQIRCPLTAAPFPAYTAAYRCTHSGTVSTIRYTANELIHCRSRANTHSDRDTPRKELTAKSRVNISTEQTALRIDFRGARNSTGKTLWVRGLKKESVS